MKQLFVSALVLSASFTAKAAQTQIEVASASCISNVGVIVKKIPVVISYEPKLSISYIVVGADGKPTIQDQLSEKVSIDSYKTGLNGFSITTAGEKTYTMAEGAKAYYAQDLVTTSQQNVTREGTLTCVVN